MATELKIPGSLPMSRYGSQIIEQGIILNDVTTSGWTQRNEDDENLISFTQRDSPRQTGRVDVNVYSGFNTDGALDYNKLYFSVVVQECSNGHKFWLGQTFTIVYTCNGGTPTEEDVTFTYTLTDDNFKLTPNPVIPDPTYNETYYGYYPATNAYAGGYYFGAMGNMITLSNNCIFITVKSVDVTPHNFFQPPGG
jgi:hypothetical protein